MADTEHIFIVDDDPISIFIIGNLFKKSLPDKTFKVFENSIEALEQVKDIYTKGDKLPELILLDINNPILDAWQFLNELDDANGQFESKCILMSSTIGKLDSEQLIKDSKVAYFFEKPIELDKIEFINTHIFTDPINATLLENFTHGDAEYKTQLLTIILKELNGFKHELNNESIVNDHQRLFQIAHRLKYPFKILSDEHKILVLEQFIPTELEKLSFFEKINVVLILKLMISKFTQSIRKQLV